MKKYISILAAASLVCTLAAGCSSKKAGQVSEIVDPQETVLSPDSIVFDWQDAYESKLSSFAATADSRFDLRDITGDGSPELIISPDTQPSTKCEVYTCSGGALQKIDDIGSGGEFTYLPGSNIIGSEYVGDGFVIGDYFQIKGTVLETETTYYNNAGSASSGAVIYYEINGDSVTLPEYERALSVYTDADSLSIGRKYSFGADSLYYAIHLSESWGAVLTDTQRELCRVKLTELSETYAGMEDYSLAFELCDLDGSNTPELVFSTGEYPEDICRIFMIGDEELTELDGAFGAYGQISLDITQKIFFSTSAAGALTYQTLTDETLSGFTPSDSVFSCGRKYILSDESLVAALN